eukprot:1160111-Pelagomonas_calceolata.AAC.15
MSGKTQLNPGHNGMPCIPDGVVPHILAYHLASGIYMISLAKPWSQVGLCLSKWTLAAVFQTAIICKSQVANLMLVEHVSPATDQPESRAVGHHCKPLGLAKFVSVRLKCCD